MVKILKTMVQKHKDTLSPWIRDFVSEATSIPLPLLPQHLSGYPSRWPFPRGDLYHWIPLLNRFDSALEAFCSLYGLHDGPQTRDFTCELLEREIQGSQSLEELGYSNDGDRSVIEAILDFSRMLLQNCGNRSIYASSPHLSDLLNSTSLSLLASTLQIGTQLAQRYQASYKRMNSPHRHANAALLANHYNIDLDRVQHLAQPFVRTTVATESAVPMTPVTPSVKGKDKPNLNISPSSKTSTVYANDLLSLAKSNTTPSNSPKGKSTQSLNEVTWDEWGDVRITYYQNPPFTGSDPDSVLQPTPNAPSAPATPTPTRRNSTLAPQHGQRTSRLATNDDTSASPVRPQIGVTDDGQSSDRVRIVEIPSNKLRHTPIHDLLKEYCPALPHDVQFEVLTKLRVAYALTSSVEARRQILTVRILAVTNLAYIYTENPFMEKVLKQDADEPRRLQLTYQLADLIHPPTDGDVGVPRSLQTVALSGLRALAQHQSKNHDICTALNTNINHGVILYIVRKAVAEIKEDQTGDAQTEKDDWRDALFSLLAHVATLPRAGSDMVTAGLVPILVEVLTIRTSIAEHNYPEILQFLDAIIFNVREAFQILVNSNGLDAISDLIIHEVKHSSDAAENQTVQLQYQSPAVDYKIPYFSQQSLKWLFKFIHHMMTTASSYGGNFDRLLRNLIDSSQLLAALKEIIGHSHRFGSTVWTNSVTILNDFINNEPTSFAVIAEAGLSRELLQAVTGKEINISDEVKECQSSTDAAGDEASPSQTSPDSTNSGVAGESTNNTSSPVRTNHDSTMSEIVDDTPHPPTREMLKAPRPKPLAHGIMPSSEAIQIIPQAFGAICLNNSGMRTFQASKALESFFEIFESSKHVQCMEAERNLSNNLGASFDELVRHHPPLKNAIINAILDMVARVAHLCEDMASKENVGARLWSEKKNSQIPTAGDSKGKERAGTSDNDIEMGGIGVKGLSSAIDPQSTDDAVQISPLPYISAASNFLSLMFNNANVRSAFMEKGGTEFLLDMAEVASLDTDFSEHGSSRALHSVISSLAEQKPHLVVPSLLKRVQVAADTLTPFVQHQGSMPYFASFVSEDSQFHVDEAELQQGTRLVKAIVNIQSLLSALYRSFQTPIYNHRSSTTFFNQLNVADYYVNLVDSLGSLLGAATKESLLLQRSGLVPPYWKRRTIATRPYSQQSEEDLALQLRLMRNLGRSEGGAAESVRPNESITAPQVTATDPSTQSPTKHEAQSARYKNYDDLTRLLTNMPSTISSFFQTLGKALTPNKRTPDAFQRQCYTSIAEALAETILNQLHETSITKESSVETYTFWIVMLSTIKDLLVNVARHSDRPFEVITLVLQSFKAKNGFDLLNNMLLVFSEDTRQYSELNKTPEALENQYVKLSLAELGTKEILSLYLILVNGKNVIDSPQTQSLIHHAEKDKTKPNWFSSGQLVVELRMSVLPTVRRLWESDMVEKAAHQIPNRLIDIIRTIAVADHETNALRRSDKILTGIKAAPKTWKPNSDTLSKLTDVGFDIGLAREALYRTNGSQSHAAEYCRTQNCYYTGGRNPIPQADLDTAGEVNGTAKTGPSTGTATPVATESEVPILPNIDNWATGPQIPWESAAGSDDLLGGLPEETVAPLIDSHAMGSENPPTSNPDTNTVLSNRITVCDLNDERTSIRARLIDRCLDVINAHGEVTFEVSDLISTVVDKSDDPPTMRKEMGETLVNALMSFAAEEDVRVVGKKIAAYAHLLALMLQDKSFYLASVAELKENLPTLLEFVKLSPSHSSEESSPWIAHILLIIETLLSEDAQPRETTWTFPSMENTHIDDPVLKVTEPIVVSHHRGVLFEYILDILPRIGKEESLALAVLRVLVILTRSRGLAQAMGEKKNIQRLFVMAKQLAGASSARLQSPIMLILRHIIEDDETIKQIMRSEIKTFFESPRSQRHHDVQTYLHQLSSLAIRAPELFVEVTNEMIKLTKWTPSAETSPGRQAIMLKDQYQRGPPPDMILPPLQATGLLSIQDVKPTTEAGDAEIEANEMSKLPPIELPKAPIVENPDGVIHFLLCEILNYKDVEDKDHTAQPAEKEVLESPPSSGDTVMTDAASSATEEIQQTDSKDAKKATKSKPKWEDHPIFVYRCFLLQCLTELLSSYNRTKVEFINFKRSIPPHNMTPSKPRSTVINYLLNDIIPVGTLEPSDNVTLQKKYFTSTWARQLITGLLSKTGEHLIDRKRAPSDAEDEPDLLFVRKFVLENILKAYKDASSSVESLDAKYSRMLSLADLITHNMAGKDNYNITTETSVSSRSGSQLKRLMFEKGFVAALTSSIADIDLNFPGAKRAVKHILRPLKVLTQTAIELSEVGIIANPGQSEEDDIASASSVSDIEAEREDTPDLFRNSTLGMFEPGRDEESSSDSDDEDEEMYEGEFDDEEMDYGEDMVEDDEDNVSDEDEEIEGMGEIEGLSGDVNVEVIMDEDDEDDDDDDNPSNEDSEEDSDDMDEDNEQQPDLIIDEHGHPLRSLQELGEEDDWEDEGASEEEDEDDQEEEDYEGRLQEDEELRAHGIEPGSHAGGAISNLMRALSGDNHEGAVEMLQRIEAEGINADEQMELGYLEEEHDDEDDEDDDDDDRDDDEPLFEAFRPSGIEEPIVWDEESFQTNMLLGRHGNHNRSRHGIPSPFPYFQGGPRDPPGGMSLPLPSISSLAREIERSTRTLNDLSRRMTELTDRFDRRQTVSREEQAENQSRLDSVRSLLVDLRSPSSLFDPIIMPPRANTNQRSVLDFGRPSYRSHRPGPIPNADEGMNPLLQRGGNRDDVRRGPIHAMAVPGRPGDFILGSPFAESPVAILNDLITSLPLPGSGHRHEHTLHFHVTGGPRGEVSRDLQAMFGMSRGFPSVMSRFEDVRVRREITDETGIVPYLRPQTTLTRWTEEAKLLFGPSHADKTSQKLTVAVMAIIVPPALQLESDAQKLAEEVKKKREEEEAAAKAKKEAEEKAAKEKAEAEAREAQEAATAAERAREEELAAAADSMSGVEGEQITIDTNTQPMEGVETVADATAQPSDAGTVEDRPRVVVTIRGNQIDITDLGIDEDFLRELPEDLQEEVITSAVTDRRSQAAAAGGEPSEIDQEFLDALPAEIRDEIIQQERQDRRRREREEQRRQIQQNGIGAENIAAQDMDPGSILATFPPDLRRQVLMEQNEEVLAHLPPEFVAQARAEMRGNPVSHIRAALNNGRPRALNNEIVIQKKRPTVQMLDRAGVATLLRLMFVFQQESLKSSLYQVLQNISENKHNRAEVISTLLHILQDGSADMSAIERSFTQLSLRAKQPKDKDAKTPQPLRRTLTGTSLTSTSLSIAANTDVSPLMVVQQCLSTLIYLSKVNMQIPGFFLTEHESGPGLKRSASRLKGKAKDTKSHKFAVNSLLMLLDRKLIMESSSVMESLSDLLSRATQPLQNFVRSQKRAEEAKKIPPPTVVDHVISEAVADATTPGRSVTEVLNGEVSEVAPQTEQIATSSESSTSAIVSVPLIEIASNAAESSEKPVNTETSDKEPEKKKDRPLVFPVIPENNLKLVVNIFVARECSAKTFRDTLITIKNLSCIPGVKGVFGKELIRKAQDLGETILLDLEELLPQIQKASTGIEIQGLALTKFSPSGSDQNKLLRVLTALDHLFAATTPAVVEGDSESATESFRDTEKQDLLATLYENSTFGPMWEKLSACLSAIRLREQMLNVATILLPLIESLMVVCKNTTLKDTTRSQVSREMNLTSPPPESRMENLFFIFTEEHRKILNDLVRHTPKLMSGTFSLLVKNPKVLEFDNKRNFFTRSIHNRNTQGRPSYAPLQLAVRRDQVFHDSFKSLYFKNGEEMKFGKLSIRFHGEEGVDAGGVTREWFQVLSRQMFDPGYALFVPVSSDRTTFHPNSLSSINPEHLMFFKFIGRVIGKALYEGRVLDCHFSRAVYKRILGKAVSIKDMESLDPEYYKSIVWMLENDITDIITETFSVDKDTFGVVEVVDLIESGRNIPVTEDNKQEYIRLMVEYKLTGSVREQLDEFLKGFHDIIPAELIAIFNEQELELLISGLPEINVDDWKGNTEYHNYSGSSPQIQWFWRAVRSFDKEERAKLLQFVTGTSKVPLNGFKELEGMNGFSRFNIHRDYGNKDRLPSSHTCFNQLDLPEYENYEALRQQLLLAITAGSEYFGFA